MVFSFHARELFLLPALGFAAPGLALALPCRALLDVSKVTTSLTGR